MIVLKSGCSYLKYPRHGEVCWTALIEEARKFEDLTDFQNNAYNWEREALSLLTIEVITIL